MEDAKASDARPGRLWNEKSLAMTALLRLNVVPVPPAVLCLSPSLLANHSLSRLR
jgi:hypothetical protein